MQTEGKGGVLATKAVETEGKGGVLAMEAVETEGKGGVLPRGKPTLDLHTVLLGDGGVRPDVVALDHKVRDASSDQDP